jgi:2-iminoacetate synthase
MHAKYLRNKYPDVEISISLPRLRPTKGGYQYEYIVEDKEYVQILMALRLFLPRVGITLSTRENDEFRGNLLSLGITKVSAGVKTSVGGYSEEKGSTEQFEISDDRSVKEVHDYLLDRGFQPVFKDWDII